MVLQSKMKFDCRRGSGVDFLSRLIHSTTPPPPPHREGVFLIHVHQLSTLRRIIQRKSSVKNFKSSANPASPFPNKPTVENDPYPFPNVRYPCQCSEEEAVVRTLGSS